MTKMDKPPVRKLLQRQPKPKPREYQNATAPMNRQEIERELEKLNGTYCPTAAEKYQILLKRDALLSKLRTKATDVKEARQLEATCEEMCPEKERYCRLAGNLLHPYECNPDGRLNHSLAVKDYSRSAADQEEPLPHELRPPNVLQKTMDYLILKIDKSMPRSELNRWYDFTWSRTRAIRKEITQQMIVDKTTVSLVEKCVRFHIYASFCMANSEIRDFDEQMNTENLSKCLQTLRHMYDDLARKSVFCDSEPEFRAYDTLLNLADSNVLSVTHTYHKKVRDAPVFKLSMKLVCAYQSNNYVLFFRLIRQNATFLQACLCRSYFGRIRAKALHTMVKSIRPLRVPVSKFTNILAFNNDEDTESFMKALDMNQESDGMVHTGDAYQPFSEISDDKTNYGCRVIEEKLCEPLSTIIAGAPCTVPVFPKPFDSFVSDYYGKIPTNPTPTQKLTSLAQSSSLTSSQSNSLKSLLSSMSGSQKPPSVPTINQPNSVSASFNFKIGQKSSNDPPPVPQFPFTFNNPQSSGGLSTNSKFPNGFGTQSSSSSSQIPPFFNSTQQSKSLSATTTPQFPSMFNNTQQSSSNSLNASTTPQFPTNFGNARTETASAVPDEPTIELPSDFNEKARTRLVDDILNFCVDDFVWLAIHEIHRLEEERLLEQRQEIINRNLEKLPEFGRTVKQQIYEGIINFCIDDFVWLAAQKAREQETQVEEILRRHNLRIARPYAKKWIASMKFQRFLEGLPPLNNSDTRKRQSLAFDQDGPDAKRSKKFTPLKFSTNS